MPIKFDKLVEGSTLYDIHSETMGNTTLRRLGYWPVTIISIDREERSAMVSWNGNPPQKRYESQLIRYHTRLTAAYMHQHSKETDRDPYNCAQWYPSRVASNTLTLDQIANRLRDHIRKMETARRWTRTTAEVSKRRVYISYGSGHKTAELPKKNAEAYLAWLDAGNTGTHFEMTINSQAPDSTRER